MKSVLIVLAIFLMPVAGYSATITTVHVNERHVIEVDGDISDWAIYNVDDTPLHTAQFTDSASVSGTVMSMSDIDNVYFFFDVQDDEIVYGEEMYGNAFWDDSVMVLFPQKRLGLPRQMIWVTGNDTGSIIEYHDNSGFYYPSLWEALGVRASYTVHDTGYTVELSIPHALLEETIEENVISTLIETGVCDDDDGEDYESVLMMTGMFWGISSMEFSTFRYELHSSDEQDLVVNAELSEQQTTIHDILSNIADNNLLTAIKKTRAIDTPWSAPMLAFLCSKYGYIDESIEVYENVLANTDDLRLQWWGLFRISELYRIERRIDELASLYHDNRDCPNWIMGGFSAIGDMQHLSPKTNPVYTDEIYEYCEMHLNPIMIKDLGIMEDARTYDTDISTSIFYEMALTKSAKSWITSDILHLLIEFYTKTRDYDNASRCIERTIDEFGSRDPKALADQYYAIRNYEKALTYYELAFAENPLPEIFSRSCDCYLKSNMLEKAVVFFTGIYDQVKNPDMKALTNIMFADCLKQNAYYTEALSLYKKNVGDDISVRLQEQAIIGIADCYFNTNEYEKLEQYVGKIKNSNCSARTKYQADLLLNSMLSKVE